jgi:phosphate transport system substrate-binding protein
LYYLLTFYAKIYEIFTWLIYIRIEVKIYSILIKGGLNLMKKIIILLASLTLLSCLILAGCADSNSGASERQFDSNSQENVVSREEGSGTRQAFIELLGIELKSDNGTKVDQTTKEAVIANKTDVMLTTVAGDKYSIGYVSMGSLNDTVKALSVDNVEPTSENVKNGTYTLSRTFNIAIKGEAGGLVKDFIDFILSAEGQKVVSENYISIRDNAPAYSDNKPSGKIVVAGSSSVTPVMEDLREAYLAINPNAVIEVQQSDSTAGMNAAIDGMANIGMASRELKESESAQLTSIPIALDGIAIIVNPANPMTSITTEQAKGIFTGEITIWNEVIK